MPPNCEVVTIGQPGYAPGRLILLRADISNLAHQFVWCGRSLGWLPLKTTSNALFRFFSSMDEAEEAADKYITLPIQEE